MNDKEFYTNNADPAGMHIRDAYEMLGISEDILQRGEMVCDQLGDRFRQIDQTAEFNQLKVLAAFQKNRISTEHFIGSTGYGYNDIGRDDLEKVYADTFHTEDALVRQQITCGTHALSLALSANLRPGDSMLSVSGKPYDTLEEVIGIRPSRGSLKEYGISYRQIDLLEDGAFDFAAIRTALTDDSSSGIRLCAIQRSKGYLTRPSLAVEKIGEVIRFIKKLRPDVIVMVDNCYGEFVDRSEPSDYGADMTVGSLIKNPGGGLAPMGGYIVGSRECIENCAVRLTSPGLGREVGASLGINRALYQGFFLAPTVTASALKAAIFAANLYEPYGFHCIPDGQERRNDIIQAIEFGSREGLIRFCCGIQSASPVDSYVAPEPWAMPGYDSDVIMAAGAFIQGASIELSADGPLKEPYAAYFQGGLTWESAKFGILKSLQSLKDAGLI